MAVPTSDAGPSRDEHDPVEVVRIARGIASAVAPRDGLTEVQAKLLKAIAGALTGVDVDDPAFVEATRNNERPETQAWAKQLLAVIDGEHDSRHSDELYRTGLARL